MQLAASATIESGRPLPLKLALARCKDYGSVSGDFALIDGLLSAATSIESFSAAIDWAAQHDNDGLNRVLRVLSYLTNYVGIYELMLVEFGILDR